MPDQDNEFRGLSGTTPTADTSAHVPRLFERAITFLAAASEPVALRALSEVGIDSRMLAHALGVDRRTVILWRNGRSKLPREHRVQVLAYLFTLLPYLFAAHSHLNASDPSRSFWQQRMQAAQRLLDGELRADLALAREVRTLADDLDNGVRHEALRVFTEWQSQSSRRPPRRAAARATSRATGSSRRTA